MFAWIARLLNNRRALAYLDKVLSERAKSRANARANAHKETK